MLEFMYDLCADHATVSFLFVPKNGSEKGTATQEKRPRGRCTFTQRDN